MTTTSIPLIDIIAGARPNFIKIAPLMHEFISRLDYGYKYKCRLIHTGQHYDKKMSADFFVQLNIPEPDVNFNIGQGSQALQTGKIMYEYEKLLTHKPSKICIVVGDVNSTMACAIAAKKCMVKVAHVEGGIRSLDMTMPEEINRVVTDSITDVFYTTSEDANINLRNSGVDSKKIVFVGNTMIDTLIANLDKLTPPPIFGELALDRIKYIVLTLHRPSNVDSVEKLTRILDRLSDDFPENTFIFPVHPRTKSKLDPLPYYSNIYFIDPLPYLEFNYLVSNSAGVVTDSGGITEEATYLKIPCITLRNSTERPETVVFGTNVLVGDDLSNLTSYIESINNNSWKISSIPPLWDGHSAKRIVDHLTSNLL